MELWDSGAGECNDNRRLFITVQNIETKLIDKQFFCNGRKELAIRLDLAPSELIGLMQKDRLEVKGKVIIVSYP